MTPGSVRVQGELWQFTAEQMDPVLAKLDQIEAVPELYRRVAVEVFAADDNLLGTAWTYHYASDPEQDGFSRLATMTDGFVSWP